MDHSLDGWHRLGPLGQGGGVYQCQPQLCGLKINQGRGGSPRWGGGGGEASGARRGRASWARHAQERGRDGLPTAAHAVAACVQASTAGKRGTPHTGAHPSASQCIPQPTLPGNRRWALRGGVGEAWEAWRTAGMRETARERGGCAPKPPKHKAARAGGRAAGPSVARARTDGAAEAVAGADGQHPLHAVDCRGVSRWESPRVMVSAYQPGPLIRVPSTPSTHAAHQPQQRHSPQREELLSFPLIQ